MGIMKIREAVHKIRETEFVRVLRRRLNDPDLITYFNMETGLWVLAYWLSKTDRTVDEIEDLGPNLELATRDLADELERCRQATNFNGIKQKLIAKKRAKHRRFCDDMEKSKDERSWLHKRGVAPPMIDVGGPG